MNPLSSPEPRILIIPLRYIGDTILTVPLARRLRKLFPRARIDMLVSRTTLPLMEPCPYLDHVLVEPKKTGERLALLREGRYDTVFILRKSATMAMLCLLAGIAHRVGYDKQRFPWGYRRWGWFLTHRARYPSLKTETPQAVSHLSLLSACGLEPEDPSLELWAEPEDILRVEHLLKSHGLDGNRLLAVLHAASASHGKQIEVERFTPGLQRLSQAGYTIIATGLAGDRPLYDALTEKTGVPLINLAGETSLRETFALYRRVRVLLTVDSGPLHLGAAARIPKIIGVFGPTNARQWGPHQPDVDFTPVFLDLPCRPCYAKVCAHNNCRVLLTGEHIANAVNLALTTG